MPVINPNVNMQFQALHMSDADIERHVELQFVERDICLFYHQMADYSYIMSDLYYGSVYGLEYWKYLDVPDIDPDRQAFIAQGCLTLILAMAWETIEETGAYLKPFLSDVSAALEGFRPQDADIRKLHETVCLSIDIATNGSGDVKDLAARSDWVHRRFVREYFIGTARDFNEHPYFTGEDKA